MSRATIDVLRWAPSLVAAAVVRGALLLGPFLWLRPTFATPVALVSLYLSVRLAFWSPAIVIDGCGFIRGARRAWDLARGNWWRLAALATMTVGATSAAGRWLPAPYVGIAAGWLLGLVGDAAMAMMYLQRVGTLPKARPTIGELVAEHAALRRGVGDLVERPID